MARTIASANPERQNRLIFMGAILMAALAAILVFAALRGLGEDNGGGGGSAAFGDTVDVVVTSQEISAGTRISGDMLQLATLPTNGIVEGALTDREGLDGLVVRQDMAKGEQFTAAKLGQGEGDEDKTLSSIVPVGKRAVALEVDENTLVGGLVVAGDRVDVIVVMEDQSGDGPPRAFTLLQDVEVLAVAQETQKPVTRLDKDGNPIETDTAAGSLATRPDDTSANEKAKTVTLAVNPDDAALLALAQDQGTVYFGLRGQGDSEVAPVGPVTLPNE
ncbi:MAG: Flp pilus assembly protein CpaB [Chloroflexi bacterium]|nr:Flp pilus assembly protein CpaB [Chloroflexota bacterium]